MMSFTDEEGVKAIIALQKMIGIDESEEKAIKAWNNFSEWEKEATERSYKLFCK